MYVSSNSDEKKLSDYVIRQSVGNSQEHMAMYTPINIHVHEQHTNVYICLDKMTIRP